jgi:hypothetical protein
VASTFSGGIAEHCLRKIRNKFYITGSFSSLRAGLRNKEAGKNEDNIENLTDVDYQFFEDDFSFYDELDKKVTKVKRITRRACMVHDLSGIKTPEGI